MFSGEECRISFLGNECHPATQVSWVIVVGELFSGTHFMVNKPRVLAEISHSKAVGSFSSYTLVRWLFHGDEVMMMMR